MVTRIADRWRDPARRRREALRELQELTRAELGWWAWGQGRADGTLVPVAVIQFGVSELQKCNLIAMGMAPELDAEFRQPILAQMGSQRQCTSLRADIYSDTVWRGSHVYRVLRDVGASEWLHTVRYDEPDCWSNLLLLRRSDEPPFSERNRETIDLAMSSISWLHAPSMSPVAPKRHRELTARQRMVLTMLLDGRSRKQIASNLGITEETVGDHLKSIYRQYQVKSAGELSALFLQGRK